MKPAHIFFNLKDKHRTFFLIFTAFVCFFLPQRIFATPLTVNDVSGRTIDVDKPFTRIISLYSAHTENICSLSGEKLLIGISRSDNYPPSISQKQRFSYREDPEKFIGARPDLVLVRPMIERSYPEFIKTLQKTGITVVSLQPTSIDTMLVYWQKLGILTGKKKQAEKMISDFKSRLTMVRKRVAATPISKRPRVYFESMHKKMKTFAPTSIGIFVLTEAGGVNVASQARQVRKTNIANFGKERLLARGDEIDIFLAQHGRMNPVTKEIILNEPGFSAIKAIRNKRIYIIDETLVSRPTLRIIDGIEQLNRLFYQQETH